MEVALVGHDPQGLTGLRFHKMSGSGNDFVFLDGRTERVRALERADVIQQLCARRTGVGADGVVWLLPAQPPAAFRMRYRNSDGSVADICGNAALCSVRLATALGLAPAGDDFRFETDAGTISGRLRPDGIPEVTLTPVQAVNPSVDVPLAPGERRVAFANTGVPHLVVEVQDAEAVDLVPRGRDLRQSAAAGPGGANVDFLSRTADGAYRMRTYERGVEGETLACGTGAAACAAVLGVWGLGEPEVSIETTSGRRLLVSIRESAGNSFPALAGEGRIVYAGEIAELD
jgi:diaminopimelate epimerase